jgi:hypothetical protein
MRRVAIALSTVLAMSRASDGRCFTCLRRRLSERCLSKKAGRRVFVDSFFLGGASPRIRGGGFQENKSFKISMLDEVEVIVVNQQGDEDSGRTSPTLGRI